MIELEIDGKKLVAKQGDMIIQVADEAGIYIPRFCYHDKLSIAANCRMCLVEVEKAPKTLPACATPAVSGMKVFTQSEKTIASQKTVMEFLLINHPLDCPICDQGGECELQDLSLGYGTGFSRYTEGKRSFKDKNLGPLIASEMTRCIECTRCVRFGSEIAGMRELGATNRGERMEIGTYVEQVIRSELSGNVIDICPVGALTSKPYRFSARSWEMQQHPAIAPHDCVGSHIFIHTRGEEYSPARHVMRVVPRKNEAINEVWLSDRDRYSYEGVNSPDRVTHPLIKRDGVWVEVSWDEAVRQVVQRLSKVVNEWGSQQLGALISPSATVEEHYLLQKLVRGLGSHNIDHRIHQTDFSDQQYLSAYPSLGLPLTELENLRAFLLVGSEVRTEQPLANHRLRKAVLNGAVAMCVNPRRYDFNFPVAEQLVVAGHELIISLAKILKAMNGKGVIPNSIQELLATIPDVSPQDSSREHAIAEKLLQTDKAGIFVGPYAINHPQASLVKFLAGLIASQNNAKFGCFSEGANAAGAYFAGTLPHRAAAGERVSTPGLHARELFSQALRSYVLVHIEPELDCANSAEAIHALKAADSVIVLSAYRGGAVEDYADIILPVATFAENSGTYVNAEGLWQSMTAAALPTGNARPTWQVLSQLGESFGLSGFDYVSSESVRDELKAKVDNMSAVDVTSAPDHLGSHKIDSPGQNLLRLGHWPMYRIDSLVRRAKSLQDTISNDLAAIRINSQLAKQLHFKQGDKLKAVQKGSEVVLPLIVDDRIADQHVFIPAGLEATAGFGDAMAEIQLYME